MRKIYELDKQDIVPAHLEILSWQKIPERSASPRITRLMDDAIGIFQDFAQPCGLIEDFDADGFPALYIGNGMNAPDGPVPFIAAHTDAIALMSATMGDALAVKSSGLFAQGSASLGYMLNVVASVASERLGRRMCRIFRDRLRSEPDAANGSENIEETLIKVQYYCPGHCGWHISGQEKLFAALRPEEIGMSIDAHWIMHPFKSISGILAAAPMEIHRFQPGFSFCAQCRERKCAERFELLENE
jgi:hypothetical protein